jgi:hypothetical protein
MFAQHKTRDAADQVSQLNLPARDRVNGCNKIIDIFVMAMPAVETQTLCSFVKKSGETLPVLDQQAVSEIARLQSSFLFTLLHLISVAYL